MEAICLGSAVPRHDFDAVVHSAFDHAVNLQLVKNRRLITLVVAEEADLPQGIRLNTSPRFSFADWKQAEPVVCRDGVLWYEGNQVKVNLSQAKRWTCDLAALNINMTDSSTLAAWETVEKVLSDRWHLEEAANFAGQPAAIIEIKKNAKGLAAAARQKDNLGGAHSAARLVGLGPGLTPAGDDFLVGFLAGLWSSTSGDMERLGFLGSFSRAVVRLSRRTNDISRAYLFHAAHGQVSSRLADLVGAISRGESPDRLRETVVASLQVGHISGMAATAGLLVGLSVWDVPQSCLADIKALFGQDP